jgi:hypothetical protein
MTPAEHLSPAARKSAAEALLRTRVDAMSDHELDLACALLLGRDVRLYADRVEVLVGDDWRPWSVTSDWSDYGELVSSTALVSGSHERNDDPADLEKVTGHWYSCHAYIGGSSVEGKDLRTVVARSAAKLLEHVLQFRTIR